MFVYVDALAPYLLLGGVDNKKKAKKIRVER